MKKHYSISLFLTIFILAGISGCRQAPDPECINIDVAAALKMSGKFPLSEMVKDVEVIQLDTVRDAFFGNEQATWIRITFRECSKSPSYKFQMFG